MDFYILIFPRDTHYIVFGTLLYVFLRLFSVSYIYCYRKKNYIRHVQSKMEQYILAVYISPDAVLKRLRSLILNKSL